MAIIALTCNALVDEEGHELDDIFSLIPCFTRSNSVLCGVGAEPGIFWILLNFLANINFNSHSDFTDDLLDVSQSTPKMRFGSHDPQLGESMSLRPLDSSSRDTQSWRRVARLFFYIFHQNILLDTDVELGVDTAIQLFCLL